MRKFRFRRWERSTKRREKPCLSKLNRWRHIECAGLTRKTWGLTNRELSMCSKSRRTREKSHTLCPSNMSNSSRETHLEFLLTVVFSDQGENIQCKFIMLSFYTTKRRLTTKESLMRVAMSFQMWLDQQLLRRLWSTKQLFKRKFRESTKPNWQRSQLKNASAKKQLRGEKTGRTCVKNWGSMRLKESSVTK